MLPLKENGKENCFAPKSEIDKSMLPIPTLTEFQT